MSWTSADVVVVITVPAVWIVEEEPDSAGNCDRELTKPARICCMMTLLGDLWPVLLPTLMRRSEARGDCELAPLPKVPSTGCAGSLAAEDAPSKVVGRGAVAVAEKPAGCTRRAQGPTR